MLVLKKASALRGRVKDPVVTLGNFDGIHLGHQLILKKVCRRAERLGTASIVYTFEPHPLKVVAPHKSPPLIADREDKSGLIGAFGIDYLVLARFTREFASKHPREFAEEVLVKDLAVQEVWVGEDFSFGRGRTGTVEYLKRLGEEFGFIVRTVAPYKKGGAVVSSSRIRELVSSGEVKKAATLLGRAYSIKGRVVTGKEIGTVLGFPTANIRTTSELVPGRGVYAATATVDEKSYKAVANIGTAPTFGGRKKTIEVHLLDFRENLYGRKVRVSFLKRLRDEKHFATKEALARQIKRDTERARKILGGTFL